MKRGNASMYFVPGPDGEPTPVDMMTWATRSQQDDLGLWLVDKTQVGDAEVSTVFIGLGCNSLVFETMIFGGTWDGYVRRYTLRAEAQAGHDAIVRSIREGASPRSRRGGP